MWKYLFEAVISDNGVRAGRPSGFGKWDMFDSPARPKPVGIDGRKLEWHVDHPLSVNGALYRKGIAIPLNQAYEAELEPGWETLSFQAGIDDDLYPEVKVTGVLSVEGDGRRLFASPRLARGCELLKAKLPVAGVKRLRLRFDEIETELKDNPDNWADLVEIFCDVLDPVVTRGQAALPLSSGSKTLKEGLGLRVEAHPAPAAVWSVKALAATEPGSARYLLGCLNDTVYCLDEDLRTRWSYPTLGLPFSIKALDVNHDGLSEIGVMALDPEGTFSLLDRDGRLLWKRCFGPGLQVFAMGDIDGDGQVEIVVWDDTGALIVLDPYGGEKWSRRTERISLSLAMAVGDINNDGRMEILVGPMDRGLDAYNCEGKRLWNRELGPMGNIGHVGSIEVREFGNENRILVGSRPGRISMLNGQGDRLWCYSHCGRGYNYAIAAAGNLTGSDATEIAAISYDGSFCILNEQGHPLKREFMPMPFLGFDVIGNRGAELPVIVAGSAGLRDNHLYFVSLKENEPSNHRVVLPGKSDHVTPHLDRIITQINSLEPEQTSASAVYHIIFVFYPFKYGKSDARATRERFLRLKRFLGEQSAPNVSYEIIVLGPERWLQSDVASERKQGEDALKIMEEERIPFYLCFDHCGDMRIGLDAAKRILALAPTACRGFEGSEQSPVVQPGIWEKWMPYMERMVALCRERGKQIVLRNNFGAWYNLASYKNAYDLLFSGRCRDTLVAMINANNPANELDLSAVLAQWKTGAYDAWGFSSQHWNWDWYPINPYNLYPPDHMLRSDFVAASLGATYFAIEGEFYDGKGGICPAALKDRVPFQDMLKKGLFWRCNPEQLANFSSVLIQYDKPPTLSEFVRTDIWDGKKLAGAMITNFRMQTSPWNYLPRLIYGVNRYFDGLFPQTPYGMVGFLPPHAERVPWAGTIWRTDGFRLFPGDEEEAVNWRNLEQDLERAACRHPFRAKGCFLAVQQSETGYRLFLCDPAYLDPHGVQATIEINLSRSFRVWDVLENKALSPREGQLPVEIKAGVFRVLDVVFTGR
ncbi:MAG: NPCBM/NEW2 domain-containing protein [Lentisphaerae bacterium]|nr:NPCBM/NEW2 domain-containing protein [Lentisphaerota bacterium]